jgi:hypothetical protein
MSRAIASTGLAAALLATLVLAGCAAPTPQSRASAAQQTACRQRADEVFLQRNRGAVYSSDAYVSGTRDTPYSASGVAGNTSGGLPDRYSRDALYTDCIHGFGPATPTAPKAAP